MQLICIMHQYKILTYIKTLCTWWHSAACLLSKKTALQWQMCNNDKMAQKWTLIPSRVGKYRDIFENIQYFRYIYQAFAHTLLKLYEIYYQIIVCVCVHCILGEILLLFTLHCCGVAIWQKLSNTEKMLRAQVTSKTHRLKIKSSHNVSH